MNIPFLDLKAQYNSISKKIKKGIDEVLNNQVFILGPQVSKFETDFAKYLNSKYVISVDSGTDALILSLRALGIGEGDEVITPVNSFIATTLAITEVGATPIFVDCDSSTYQIDCSMVEKKISKKTKAILPVHLYGAPCDMGYLKKLAKKHDLLILEDACQAVGATYDNKKVGAIGDVGVFSFYPGKNLGAYGDGGAISTDNINIYKKLMKLRNYGQSKKYYHDVIGINSRLDELQAAVLNIKLPMLDKWNNSRNFVAESYNKNLKVYKTQQMYPNTRSCYHIFVLESNNRNKLQEHLHKKGIQTLIHYPVPIHLQKCYEYLNYKKGDFPVAEAISKRILSIPMYPELTKANLKHINNVLNDFHAQYE